MKEKAIGIWILRVAFGACILYGGLELLGGLAARVLYWYYGSAARDLGEAASIGIIGGADGPTAVFVTSPGWMHCIIPVLLLAIGILGFVWLRKRNKEGRA